MLLRPQWQWRVVTLCRASDPDRAPRFLRAVKRLGASGAMADLDDAPEQVPLPQQEVENTVTSLLQGREYDLILTHGPQGEYSRHRRHEEASKAVCALWANQRIAACNIWLFAYEDGGGEYLPRAIAGAHRNEKLPEQVWREKYRTMTEVYGFAEDSFEANATPREEAFWCFDSPGAVRRWLQNRGIER